jgi:hypothetical protein
MGYHHAAKGVFLDISENFWVYTSIMLDHMLGEHCAPCR